MEVWKGGGGRREEDKLMVIEKRDPSRLRAPESGEADAGGVRKFFKHQHHGTSF